MAVSPYSEHFKIPPICNAMVFWKPGISEDFTPNRIRARDVWLVKVNHCALNQQRSYFHVYDCTSVKEAEEIAREYWCLLKEPTMVTTEFTFEVDKG